MIGQTKLNLTDRRQLERPEVDDIKLRVHRLETQELTQAGLVKPSVASGLLFTIPSGYQYIVADTYDVFGDIDIYGELVVI